MSAQPSGRSRVGWLAALALVGVALLFTGSVARAQTACSFSGAAVRTATYVAGSAVNLAFPTASGCTAPVVYTLTPLATAGSTGTSVPGLAFDGSAMPAPTLTGTPTAPQGYSDTHVLRYTATDAGSAADSIDYRITIEGDGTPSFAQTEYSKTFYVDRYEVWGTPQATGGNHRSGSQYSLAVPAGEAANYWVSGSLRFQRNAYQMTALPTATAAETSHVLTYTDADGDVATTTLKFTVENAPRPDFFRDSVRINWILNSVSRNTYSDLDGAGGPGTTYALSGTLPNGLMFDAATRRLSGEPTESGTFALTLTATDSNGASDTQAVAFFVSPTTDPSWPPAFAGRSVRSCTEVQLTWPEPRGGNPPEVGFMLPTTTGWRIEGKQRGVDASWRLIAEPEASARSYTHTVPPGSAWTYRIRAVTAGGVNPWSPDIHASTSINASRPYRALEVGMTIGIRSYATINGGEITTFEWYRSPDQASLDWSRVPGGPDGFYDVTEADVGRLLGVSFYAEEFLSDWIAHTSLVRVIQSLAGVFDPVTPDESPAFAASSRRIEDVPAGAPVTIQLPAATGGSGTIVYALSPELPDGLVFDADALTITGAPADEWRGDYTLTARDDDCDMATWSLAIGPPPSPLPATPWGSVTMTVATTGEAPDGAVYGLRLDCGHSVFSPALAAGERYTAQIPAGAVCSLSAADAQGASAVLGEVAEMSVAWGNSDVALTFVYAEAPEAVTIELDAGLNRVLWPASEPALETLPSAITAIHFWDADAQRWLSWYPGADALGVNTLTTLRPNAPYLVYATEAVSWTVPLD